MNELLLFLEILFYFGGLVLINRFVGKYGIYAWIGIATILAEIQVIETVNIFGISASLGNVLFASTFLATDMLRECYGQKEAKVGPIISLISVIIFIFFSISTPLFEPNEFDINAGYLKNILAITPRVCIASGVMLFLANFLDVLIYDFLHRKFNGKKLWVRNNISTIVCNGFENFFFVFLAFYGIYPISELLMIAISTCIIEIIIAICDTPFIYLAKKFDR